MTRSLFLAIVALGILLAPLQASAANILFVSTGSGDANIVTVLRGDGHTVTMGSGAGDLAGDLTMYDAVYWSATGSYSVPATTFTNITEYVRGGGRVFVTGYDSIISNVLLANLCGGSSARDLVGSPEPGVITSIANSLTVGVVDIRGVRPTGGHTDRDGLMGLMADTVEVTPSEGGGTSQWALRALGDGEVAWVSNGTYSGTHPSWEVTGAGGAGAYNAALRNFAFAADFAMSDPGAPEITFDTPFTVDEGQEIPLNVAIVDREGDTFTFSWDLDDDASFGEHAGMANVTVPADATDGTRSMRIGVQAVDSRGNTATRYRHVRILNVDPRITSDPPRTTSVGADYRYAVVADDPAGALDPLEYMLVRGPSRMTITPAGVVQWTPTDSDVTLPGETVTIEILVGDGDEGTASQTWELTVSPNRRPSAPVPAYPSDGIAIVDGRPRLAAANGQDLDLDTLRYFYELDTADTFDSPELRTSGPVEETPGFTAWQLEAPLAENRVYHWRVWVNDGTIDSDVRTTSFWVVRDPSLGPPDAGPRDAGRPGDASLIPGADAGLSPPRGGCSVGGSAGSSSGGWMLALLAALALARRRRC